MARWALGVSLLPVAALPALAHDEAGDSRRGFAPPLLPAAAVAAPAAPRGVAAPSRFYIGNDDHTDYMWAGTDAQYRQSFATMLDFYMSQAENTAGNPPDSRGRFNLDGSVWAWEYEHTHTPQQFQRLVSHLRDGNLTMPLNALVQLYGAMPAEAVLRSFYYAGRLERREGLRFPLVVPMEDQTLPGGVASLWAGSGARYSWKGVCDCNSPLDLGLRPREIYRFTGPDGQSVVMKWNSLLGTNQGIGGYAEARNPAGAVNTMATDPTFLARWPYAAAAAFGYGWDDLQSTTNAFVDASASLSNTSRRVIVSNEVDFFQDFEALYGEGLESFGASFGNDWELRTAAMGEVTAAMKRSVEKLRTAEALATVAALHDSDFMAGREALRDSADLACGLYYEHSWGPGPGVTVTQRAAWQRRIQATFTRYVESLESDALVRLGTLVAQPAGVERHVVFNPLSWIRTDVADLDVAMAEPLHVIDVATALEVPSQVMQVGGQRRVRILASDVPSVGYKVYEIVAGPGAAFPASALVSLPAMDNTYYRVTLGGRGQIVSLVDHKDQERELAGAAGLHDLGSGAGAVTLESAGPVSATLRVSAGGNPAHETRVTLYAAGVDRVDVEGRITQNFSGEVAYTYDFALPGATTRHEEVGMIAQVGRRAQGGDYADQDTGTDYLTLNHFVDLSTGERGVTLSAWDTPFFKPGNSTPTVLDAATPTVHCLVGMPSFSGGIPGQDGDAEFTSRFALRSHTIYDPTAAMKTALAHQNPLVATRVTGNEQAPLPADQWSLLAISATDFLLWALKPAEEGIASGGIIARVWSLADAPRVGVVTLPPTSIVHARHVTHIETDIRAATLAGGGLRDTLGRQQMHTYRIFPAPGPAAGVEGGPRLAVAAYPNPLSPGATATLTYALPAAGRVRITVHDVTGARVADVADGMETAGTHFAAWSGKLWGGREAPAGMYFIRVALGGRSGSARVVKLK